MITDYFTLSALAREFDSILTGYRIEEVYSQQKNELIISCITEKKDPLSIIIGIEPKFNYLYYGRRVSRARKNSVDLFPAMTGEQISSVAIIPFERIMEIDLGEHLVFFIHLYNTSSSNCYLIDHNRSILERFKHDADVGTTVLPVTQSRVDIALLTDDALFSAAIIEQGSKPIGLRIKQIFPFLGIQYSGEICARAGVDGTVPAVKHSPAVFPELRRHMQLLLEEIQRPRPVLYGDGDTDSFLSVIPLLSMARRRSLALASVNEGLQRMVGSTHRRKSFEEERDRIAEAVGRELKQTARSRQAAAKEASAAARSEEHELAGKLIMAHIHTLAKGMSTAALPDLFGDNELRTIALDPRFPPAQNAERYFQKARQPRSAAAESIRRLDLLTARESSLAQMFDRIGRVDSRELLDEFTQQYTTELRALNLQSSGKPIERPPFRIFDVAGGLEVWVGKNSANNDLLTTRYATPHDLWFHVRGAGGSHTVLKVRGREEPPREAIRQAAAIAAYYSKMRNAGTVPVAYCARKYVRKPRRAASGSVTLEREEIIFVRPALP